MPIKTIIFLLLLLSGHFILCQQEVDNRAIYFDESESDSVRLKALKNLIWDEYIFKDADSAKFFIEQGKSYAKATNNLERLVDFTSFSGIISSISGDQLKAIDYFEEALVLLEGKTGEYKSMTATLYNNLGNVFAQLGNTSKAIDMYTESLKIMVRLNNYVGMGNAYNNIANLHKKKANNDVPISYYRKAFNAFEKAGNYIGMGNVATNLVSYKSQKNELDSALYFCELAMENYNKINNNIGVSQVHSKLADIYVRKGDFSKALNEQNKALTLVSDFGNKKELALNLSKLASIYFEMGDLDKADELSEEGLKLSESAESVFYTNDIRYSRYLILKEKGNKAEALELLEKYLAVKDSLDLLETEELLTQKKYEYEYAKKTIQDSLARVEHDNYIVEKLRRKEAEINQGKQRNIFLIVIVLIIGGSAIFIFRRLRVSQKQKKIIESQKEKVEDQRNILDLKNKEIMDSINYAKRLQDAILPSKIYFQTHFEDHFIFYKPKDVVSGDFYWLERIGNELYLAAADCTGHGVPGAMVSVVCSNALTKAVLEEKKSEPSDILGRARDIIVEHFGRGGTGIYDGMDVALIKVVFSDEDVRDAQKIVFAGAHNPFWMIRNGEFTEIKGDSQPVGNYAEMKPFKQHELAVEKGDMVYLFSDGYIDQFGGPMESAGGKKYKRGKFRKLVLDLAKLPMEAQKNKLSNEIENWQGDLPQTDDIVVIGLKF